MSSANRLEAWLALGELTLAADGPLVVLRARPDLVRSALPRERVVAVQGFRPDHDALARLGFDVRQEAPPEAAAVIVQITRSRVETMGLIAQGLGMVAPGCPVIVDGARTDGVDAVLRSCRAVLPVGDAFAKAHGKVFAIPRPEHLPAVVADWAAAARPRPVDGGFLVPASGFSAQGMDAGSAALSAHLGNLAGEVVDLGAGWGALAPAILASPAVTGLTLVEAEHDALEAARRNVTDPRARFLWEDATTHLPGQPYDIVVSNPPFHAGRRADPEIGRAFIAAAARMLAPRGRLLMVANRHLPYEAALAGSFGEVRLREEAAGFKIIEAGSPRRAGAAPRVSRRRHRAR